MFGISNQLSDERVIEGGCTVLREIMEKGGVLLTLSAYGSCPSKEYVMSSLDPEDLGEFTQDEMYQMMEACYLHD